MMDQISSMEKQGGTYRRAATKSNKLDPGSISKGSDDNSRYKASPASLAKSKPKGNLMAQSVAQAGKLMQTKKAADNNINRSKTLA